MTQYVLDTQNEPQFEWPEPLIIDVINEKYRHVVEPRDSIMLAKMQERTLRALFYGATPRSSELRLELTVCCAARGIDRKTITTIDKVVLLELVRLVDRCFRTCPRKRLAIAEELNAAFGSLVAKGDATTSPFASVPKHLH